MILGLGGPELIVILLVVLVIFGPKNLPKLGSALGKTVKNVREGMEGEDDETDEDEADEDDEDEASSK
ncbi:MAG: twin-arginine translocase TatA/TatE family subunit [Atopobiaceae bacterium]|nr:twin-arginine translocase TatA/TatE family subunit [Atopobiaceae bacterium]